MQYQSEISPVSTNRAELEKHLSFGNARVLELGCGDGATIRELALANPDCEFIATEIDQIQLAKNLSARQIPNLTFKSGVAQQIELPDESVDAVIMLKSFHHVPVELMDQSLLEIRRVLRPSGLAFISEPVYEGDFNEILKLFNDEQQQRASAYSAICKSIADQQMQLVQQIFFDAVRTFHGFADYDRQVLGQTHTDFKINSALRERIQSTYATFADEDGVATFRCPQRIDLLRSHPE